LGVKITMNGRMSNVMFQRMIMTILALSFISACSHQDANTIYRETNTPSIRMTEITLTETPVPVITPSPNDETPEAKNQDEVILTPTNQIRKEPILDCKLSIDSETDGLKKGILFETKDDRYLIHSDNHGETIEIPLPSAKYIVPIGFSQDGNQILYASDSDIGIGVVDKTGNVIEHQLSIEELRELVPDDMQLSGWSNFEVIGKDYLTLKIDYRELVQVGTFPSNSIQALIDYSTGRWANNYLLKLPGWNPTDQVFFSHNMAYAFYPVHENRKIYYAIYDVGNKTILWQTKVILDSSIFKMDAIHNQAAWSPNNQFIAFVSAEHSRYQGEKKRGVYVLSFWNERPKLITNFASEHDRFESYQLTWSPDNKYLAFILSVSDGPESEHTLFIYDVEREAFKLKCQVPKIEPYFAKIFWAPDSNKVALSHRSLRSTYSIIEIGSGNIYEYADVVTLLGWSDRFNEE
jgi:WD40 repeat protein